MIHKERWTSKKGLEQVLKAEKASWKKKLDLKEKIMTAYCSNKPVVWPSTIIVYFSVLFFYLLLPLGCSFNRHNPEQTVRNLISAIQRNDLNIALDLSYHFHKSIAQIHSNNPKSMWPKLSEDYRKAIIAQLTGKQPSLESILRIDGGLTHDLKELINLMGSPCNWKITESRRRESAHLFMLGDFNINIVYVDLAYRSIEEAPIIDNKPLKKTIIEIIIDADTGLFIRSKMVDKATEYWDFSKWISSKVTTVKFFESGYDLLPINQRKYQNAFPSSQTRYINCQINLQYPVKMKNRISFRLDYEWHGHNWNINSYGNSYIEPEWNYSYYSSSVGAGGLRPGSYSVVIKLDGKQVASGEFIVY